MDKLTRRSFGIQTRNLDREARTADFVCSTDAIDSYDEIVDQDWDLKRYRANPVVLYFHNSTGGFLGGGSAEETLPIGCATRCEVVGNQLEATIRFVDERANPLAEKVWQGICQGSIRAVSVGFNPHNVKAEKVNDVEVLRLTNNELFEISVCPMGANPEAVMKALRESHENLRSRVIGAPTVTDPTKEHDMNELEQLRAKHAELETAHAAATKALEAEKAASAELTTKAAELEQRLATVTTERDAAVADAKSANDKLVERDVDALVGVKFDPAARDEWLALAKTDKAAFDALMAKTPAQKTLEQHKLGADPKPLTNHVAADGADTNGKAFANAKAPTR